MIEQENEIIPIIENALSVLNFEEGVREAKYKSPQSYVFHTVSVGTLSMDICKSIYDVEPSAFASLEKAYNKNFKELCFYVGFLHDWNKLEGKEDRAKEIAKALKFDENQALHFLSLFAEGTLPDNVHLPIWISVKLADMLMISDIRSVNDVVKYKESPSYVDAIKALNSYGLDLKYVSSTFRLFTLLASNEIINLSNGVPLISYTDGFVYLSKKDSPPVSLLSIYNVLEKLMEGKEEGTDAVKDKIEKCLNSKREFFEKLNDPNSRKSTLYNEGKAKQVNAFLPSKLCSYFEDQVGLLSPELKVKVAEEIIERHKDDIPYGVLMYFIEKFSSSDKDYIKKGLGIKEKFPHYMEEIDDPIVMLDKVKNIIRGKYSSSKTTDLTLLSFVKKSFSGYVQDDLPEVKEKPYDYCVVCGTSIYDKEPVRFKQFAELLSGKTEIFIPRETALDEIDRIRDDLHICKICNYEASQLKNTIQPPYFIVSFYPGIPVSLLKILDYDASKIANVTKNVTSNSSYLEVFRSCGGNFNELTNKKSIVDYLSSKVIIKASDVAPKSRIITRLDKTTFNKILPYAPLISISYLSAPVKISSTILDIPEESRSIDFSSEFNYTWTKLENKEENNYKTLLLLLSYYEKIGVCKDDNCINEMASEMDLFASVDPSLSVVAFGEEDNRFFSYISPRSYFLNFTLGKVSKMGETLKNSLYSIAANLKEMNKQAKSKYDVIGFLRDGIDMFFKTSSTNLAKDDRIGIAVNASLSSLENQLSEKVFTDDKKKIMYYKLNDVFSILYDIENQSDRSLAISISNAITNWLYILYKTIGDKNESK
ncbi:CRISPR-associated protein [Metallosphaera javensis (ex Sakai et al. 2022)]|uniref:CRISPR-associated protein n=1 Tax=Metallosphaera javensis (ex Sakai et al. 2022) TaxID=2775498 RepID=UPI00258B3D86|nr:MAG: hypothetical protein MjAS7_2909 [Metallosphaera javensis (ex Sakai et al. 2022)]